MTEYMYVNLSNLNPTSPMCTYSSTIKNMQKNIYPNPSSGRLLHIKVILVIKNVDGKNDIQHIQWRVYMKKKPNL